MKRRIGFVCLTMIACMGLVCGAAGASTVYTDEASFLTALNSPYYLEDFTNITFPNNTVSVDFGPVNGFSYTLSAPGGLWNYGDSVSTDMHADAITITFTGANVSAVGGLFWPTDVFQNDLTGEIDLGLSDGTSVVILDANFQTFIGFTAAPGVFFSSMTVASAPNQGNSSNEFPTMDHFYVGTAAGASPVPEPATMILLGSGLIGLAGYGKKKFFSK